MLEKIRYRWLMFIGILISGLSLLAQTPYLSRLNATRESPLYTTYAAALERSEFALDEGYHFRYYDSTRGIDFTTDTGGDLCLAFLRGADYVYESDRFAREPVITLSYPDMVRYFYFPYSDVRVEAVFLVQSSHIAVQEVKITNIGREAISLQVIPFMQNNDRVFDNVQFFPDQNAIAFTHQELPDGWTLDHKVPYVSPVRDVFLISRPPDRQTSYRSYQWGNVPIPQEFRLDKKPVYVVWGRMDHANGERCRHKNPNPRITVRLSRYPDRILTETAPRWGSTDPNLSPYGYYGIELGNFGEIHNGDVYTINIYCPETGESAVLTDTIRQMEKEPVVRRDVQLQPQELVKAPQGMGRDIWGSGTEMRLFWKHTGEAVTYDVFRRDYRHHGFYRRLASGITRDFFTDKNIQGDQIYGYVVEAVDARGRRSPHSREINNIAGSDFLTDIRYPDQIRNKVRDFARVVAMPVTLQLSPGTSQNLRIVRAVARPDTTPETLIRSAREALSVNFAHYQAANEKLFARLPTPHFSDPDQEMLYWSAFNLMRQVMLPPEGKCGYNYYVFSREPSWGWGHGGQVFHESLTMLAYSYLDGESAMNSQRVYRERQHPDGYINYRTGPYLDETIPYHNQLTTSAPWYAWQNWEVYRITGDRRFLQEMYRSSKRFYEYYVKNRDADGDGLCEWGAHAVLESVRDAYVAVWDEVGWPSNFEGVDVNVMLVSEAQALAQMARELGLMDEAESWEREAEQRKQLINKYMWDDSTGFYYHVDKKDNDFTFKKKNDLKRQEIIGFLPLWAGVADSLQAERLIEKLIDPEKFWRTYGVPSLAADDPYYNPRGYWNGPVWVEWNLLIEQGLLHYGRHDLARKLVDRVAANMIDRLKNEHVFWEFYSPDEPWGGYHKQYIWAGTICRMLMNVYGGAPEGKNPESPIPGSK